MKKFRLLLLFVIVTLFVGVSYATDASNDTFSINEDNIKEKTAIDSDINNIQKADIDDTKTASQIKSSTRLTVNKISQKTYKDDVVITGRFTDNKGKVLKNSIVKVSVNGKVYNAKTDSKGVYIRKVTAGKIGTNNVVVSFNGNNNYMATSIKTSFQTLKGTTKLSLYPFETLYVGSYVDIYAQFADSKGKPLKNTILTLNFNGNKQKIQTNDYGEYIAFKKITKSGTNKISISFAGNKYYNARSLNRTFNVKSTYKSLTLPVHNYYYEKRVKNDLFETWYTSVVGSDGPGVCVRIWDATSNDPLNSNPDHVLSKAIFFYKNSRGNVIKRTVTGGTGVILTADLVKGYTPYKVDVYYIPITFYHMYKLNGGFV